MKCLLDTCVLLWVLEENTPKLKDFLPIIMNPQNQMFVSLATYWEIAIKRKLGRISFKSDIDLAALINESGFLWLSIETRHIDALHTLPLIHHDPFDRLLLAQSKVDGLDLLTADEKILRYKEVEA